MMDWEKAEDVISPSPDNDMLNQEEQQFVTNTVEWLRGRENRDMVMATIWSRVIGSDPDSFYVPPAEETDDAPLDIEATSAGEEQELKTGTDSES